MYLFAQAAKDVEDKCSVLLTSSSFKIGELHKGIPSAGIYLFSENGQALYVGRTNNLRKRLQCHIRNDHNQATFAFLLARDETGKIKATYRKTGSRCELMKDPKFKAAFDSARERILRMDVQFIEETDPTRQALLEICPALSSGAKYNDFDNH